MTRARRVGAAVALVAVVGTAACGPSDAETATEDEDVLEVFGPWTGTTADLFKASIQPFEDDTGIEVTYTGSADFATELERRINDASPPDVALVPQPALVTLLDERDAVFELDRDVLDEMSRSILPKVRELGTVDDRTLAVPYKLSVKSLVWYPPQLWADEGWEIPNSFPALLNLTDRMVEAGLDPWCFGINDFGATGWVVTDWIEDFVLRIGGADAYDDWVAGERGFGSAEVEAAFAAIEDLLLAGGHTLGGTSGIVRTRVSDAVRPMLEDPPACAMHRNASFTRDWLPDDTEIGPEEAIDVFVLPPAVSGRQPPLLVGVDSGIALSERAETQDFLRFLATTESGVAWREAGAYVGGRIDEDHGDDTFGTEMAALLADTAVVRVDASDQMVPDFGSADYLEIVSAWVSGEFPTSELGELLDASRDLANAVDVDGP